MRTKAKLLFFMAVSLIFIAAFSLQAINAQESTTDGEVYVVQANDTLSKLADQYFGEILAYPLIVEATNNQAALDSSFARIDNPDLIEVGQKLFIPTDVTEMDAAPAAAPTPAAPAPVSTSSSPGGQIAFSFFNDSTDRCVYEINVINVAACQDNAAQCQATRRVINLNNISEPAFSPDGQRLAFRSFGPHYPDTSYASEARNCAEPISDRLMASVSLDGTDFEPLAGFWEDGHPDWSPDGFSIVFDSTREEDRFSRIYVVNTVSGEENNLRLRGMHPSWAPDNNRFVFRGCDETGNRCGLWIATRAGALVSPVIETPEAAHPDWSPQGGQIVYQSPESGSWDLYVVNEDGTNKRRLTSEAGVEGLPTWSPDGQWVGYLSNQGDAWTVNIIRADGTQAQTLFALDGGIFTPKDVPPFGLRDWPSEQMSWGPLP